MDERYDVIVIGAGLAGLAAARLAARSGARTVVLDGQPAGGRARSDERGGFVLNRGPHALYLGGPAEQVLRELGLGLAGASPSGDQAHATRGSLVAPLPGTPRRLLASRLLGARGKVAVAALLTRLPRLDTHGVAGLTVAGWLDGLRLPADARALVELLVRVSSYGNQPEVMSAEVAVSQLQAVLAHGVRYLHGGWQSLVDELAQDLRIERAVVTEVGAEAGRPEVVTADGRHLGAGTVILAPGSPDAAARLLGRAPFDVGPPLQAACLDLGTAAPSQPRLQFGLDEPLYLSTHCPPAGLAPPGRAVVHVARYLGAGDDASPEVQRAELAAYAALAGLGDDQVVEARYLHRMTVVSAVATAAGGGLAGRPGVGSAGVDGVLLAGDWVGPVGHLADASLASAAAAARAACARVRA